MFERPGAGERAVLVHVALPRNEEDIDELAELTRSAGADPVAVVTTTRAAPDPQFFIGSGKVEALRAEIAEKQANLVLFNHSLTPSQERNLEKALAVRVVDRNGLILDIFAQRARSFEGKLQVELAQLRHLSTRLVRGWTHLERQKGGIGLRGPGETQLETDRRLLGVRIKQIQKRLEKVERQRQQGRAQRQRAEVPSVSLVGYTNAGKSTLFNALTGAEAYAADQLFATLDPTLRRCELPNGGHLVLADTVGFIRHLPHELVAAFRSTLQEACEADLLLHVVDASAAHHDATREQVDNVLEEIGAGEIKQLLIYNKIDKLPEAAPRLDRDEHGQPCRVWLSAHTGVGLDLLYSALVESFADQRVTRLCHLTAAQGNVRAQLFACARILGETAREEGGWDMRIEIDKRHLGILKDIPYEGGD